MKKKDTKAYRKKLEKELDKEWSSYVRNRDKVCQKCSGSGSISAHHGFGRRHLSTRWDVFNGVGFCYPCHIHWAHRDPAGFSVWFEEHIGRDTFDRLAEVHRQITKFTVEELEDKLNWFKEQK